jgi:hypothetical protein
MLIESATKVPHKDNHALAGVKEAAQLSWRIS